MLTHGPRIMGQEAYDKAVAAEQEQQRVHGGQQAMYGPRITGAAPASTPPALPETAVRPTVAQIQSLVTADPSRAVALAAEELASETPRKGAIASLLMAARKLDDTDLVALLDAAMED